MADAEYQADRHTDQYLVRRSDGAYVSREEPRLSLWLAEGNVPDAADPLPEPEASQPSQNEQLAAMGRTHADTIRAAIAANDLRALGTATADALVAMSEILEGVAT